MGVYTQDQITKALQKVGAATKCNACGGGNWSCFEVMEENQYTGVVLFTQDGGMTTGGIPTLCLICDNCGYIRLHAARVLQQYM